MTDLCLFYLLIKIYLEKRERVIIYHASIIAPSLRKKDSFIDHCEPLIDGLNSLCSWQLELKENNRFWIFYILDSYIVTEDEIRIRFSDSFIEQIAKYKNWSEVKEFLTNEKISFGPPNELSTP